jgi:hypothetical protein
MSTRSFVTVIVVAAITVAAAAAAMAGECSNRSNVLGDDTCCFNNPRYTGTCEVTPGPDETCADILAYLNNQASVGKTYCGNTKVRGGWSQVDCNQESSATDPASIPEAEAEQ